MRLRVIIEPDEDVYTAYCPELPGCVTYGKSIEEAKKNIKEAIELYLRPDPTVVKKDKAEVFELEF